MCQLKSFHVYTTDPKVRAHRRNRVPCGLPNVYSHCLDRDEERELWLWVSTVLLINRDRLKRAQSLPFATTVLRAPRANLTKPRTTATAERRH